jgi:hypothetical protein
MLSCYLSIKPGQLQERNAKGLAEGADVAGKAIDS